MKHRMMHFALALFLGVAFCPYGASGQVPASNAQQYEAMSKAMREAEQAASQPGDKKLSCEQLQEQFLAASTDPALQAQVSEAAAQAEKDTTVSQAAQGEIASQTATTVAGAVVPGASMAAMLATAANAEAAKARGAQHMQSRMAQAGNMLTLLPSLMRGQRLMELATEKKCAWSASFQSGDSTAEPSREKSP
jgi:hypothetical protein